MARRYNMTMYMQAVENLRAAFPMAAFTTDVLTCFPGETEAEYQETRQTIRDVGYAKIHVFPYSPREGTKAAVMPGQLSKAVKEQRTRELIALGEETAAAYQAQWLGKESTVLIEEKIGDAWHGYTPEYIPVTIADCPACVPGRIVTVRLAESTGEGMVGEIV